MSILMSPVLIRYHVDHSGLLPWEICDLLLQQYGKLGSHHPPCIYLIVQFQYACIAVSELLTRPPWKIALSTRVRCCLCTVSFAVVLQTPYFQSCLESTVFFFFSTPFSEVVSYVCNTVRLFGHILHFVLGFP